MRVRWFMRPLPRPGGSPLPAQAAATSAVPNGDAPRVQTRSLGEITSRTQAARNRAGAMIAKDSSSRRSSRKRSNGRGSGAVGVVGEGPVVRVEHHLLRLAWTARRKTRCRRSRAGDGTCRSRKRDQSLGHEAGLERQPQIIARGLLVHLEEEIAGPALGHRLRRPERGVQLRGERVRSLRRSCRD